MVLYDARTLVIWALSTYPVEYLGRDYQVGPSVSQFPDDSSAAKPTVEYQIKARSLVMKAVALTARALTLHCRSLQQCQTYGRGKRPGDTSSF